MKLVSARIDDVTHYWNGKGWTPSLTQAKELRTDEANDLIRQISIHNRQVDPADRIEACIVTRSFS